jgi:hypothetical protein
MGDGNIQHSVLGGDCTVHPFSKIYQNEHLKSVYFMYLVPQQFILNSTSKNALSSLIKLVSFCQ